MKLCTHLYILSGTGTTFFFGCFRTSSNAQILLNALNIPLNNIHQHSKTFSYIHIDSNISNTYECI